MKKLPTACGFALCLLLSISTLALARADDGPTKINFDDIKLKLEKGQTFRKSMLTKKAKSYDGKTISIRGYMIPSFKADGITDFVLMRNTQCKFGSDAAHHFIHIRMTAGQSASYTLRPITIVGDFKIKQFKVGKKTWAIYEINDGSLKK